jgi:hypothetical protein
MADLNKLRRKTSEREARCMEEKEYFSQNTRREMTLRDLGVDGNHLAQDRVRRQVFMNI